MSLKAVEADQQKVLEPGSRRMRNEGGQEPSRAFLEGKVVRKRHGRRENLHDEI